MSVRSSAIALLSDWQPPDYSQDSLRNAVLAFLDAREDACRRACVPGHITASALVLDDTGGQVLLTLHPRLGRWVQLGGHCEDSDADILGAALREATEESGIEGLQICPDLAAINVHALTCSLGVPTRHLDLQFVAQAPAGRADRGQRGISGPAMVADRRAARRHRRGAGLPGAACDPSAEASRTAREAHTSREWRIPLSRSTS